MEVVAGAMSPLLGKLGELLKDEYNLTSKVRRGIVSLETELVMMHAALRKVAGMPPDQLDEQVKIWAGKVRELSYDMEDAVDAFMVRVDGRQQHTNLKKGVVNKFLKKTVGLFRKGKDLRQIAGAIGEAQDLAKQLAELRERYELDVIHGVDAGATVDPRVMALYKDVTELVGIELPRDELIERMFDGEEGSKQRLRTISIVGFGGLGKTTLAKAVYDKIKGQFDCSAFISVSQNPDVSKIFKSVLSILGVERYADTGVAEYQVHQLIDKLREYLEDKRYLIVMDDVWDEKAWRLIRCAFTTNHLGSRIITTTRKISVSEACCSSSDDITYRMKHLSDADSQRLFYRRIFSHENECPQELEQVSRDILKKCGGVPLAIITIASLLSSTEKIKTKDQWHALLHSIGHGLTEGANVEEMQRILSFSYYDLSSPIKTCLLYLSIFPEDSEIPRDQLIWRWIAEGFVKCEEQKTGLFELGESYFNSLINRSMIQPVDIDVDGKARACRVHDMVLDLILQLSSGENFVTIFDGIQQKKSSQSKVRRLALQNSVAEPNKCQVSMIMSQVRSVTVFSPAINMMPPLSSFDVLRVLDIESCKLQNLMYIGKLFHLRYLRLGQIRDIYKDNNEFLVGIENLQFLQTLEIEETSFLDLPWSIFQLRRLMCLRIYHKTNLPDGIGNLTSLEVLSDLNLSKSTDNVKQLQNLTRLRELSIIVWLDLDETLIEPLVESMSKLHKIETLRVEGCSSFLNLFGSCWVPPPHLRKFAARCFFDSMPAWIKRDPSLLSNLTVLEIRFDELLPQEDLQLLGRLPALLRLDLLVSKQHKLLIDAVGFHCLKVFTLDLDYHACCPVFLRGAMPRVRHIEFIFDKRTAIDDGNADFDFGLGNLPSLEHVKVMVTGGTSEEFEKSAAALWNTADLHPSHPTITIYRGLGQPAYQRAQLINRYTRPNGRAGPAWHGPGDSMARYGTAR